MQQKVLAVNLGCNHYEAKGGDVFEDLFIEVVLEAEAVQEHGNRVCALC
ncbi:hypothetical protein ACP4OV_031739 [Aristida adscensionis]